MTLGEELLFDKTIELRKSLLTLLEIQNKESTKSGLPVTLTKLSYLPIFVKAISLSLTKFPMLNATVNPDATEITHHVNHNIGIAMDTPKGLIVPVIEAVQRKSIFEIAKELADLQVYLLCNLYCR